jgi:uncharacterized protein YqhQ
VPADAYALNPDMLVGGQAVLEGVMMRSARGYSVAVRRPDGTVAVDRAEVRSPARRFPVLKWPVLRGSVVLIQSLILGFRALQFAAHHSMPDSARKEGAADRTGNVAITASLILSLGVGVALFVLVPLAATNLIEHRLWPGMGTFTFNMTDGLFRVVIFFAYLLAIARLPDIRRVFEYHGAEHKVVYTFESGEALTVANARGKSRLHPRCGTSFLFFVLAISILVFALIPSSAPFLLKFGSRLLFVPLIAGLAYETIRFSSKRLDHPVMALLVRPGLALQRITTAEPSDDQLEVALRALQEALFFDGISASEPVAAVL